MKKVVYISFLILAGILFISCKEGILEGQDSLEKETITKTKIAVFDTDFEQYIRREIEAELEINAAEKYDFRIKIVHLDKDTVSDAVILVNREQFAKERIKKEGKEKFFKSSGYTAKENYIFVFKGITSKILTIPPIGSSVFHPLEVYFEEITAPGQNDFYVTYRFRNSLFRNYYTLRGETLYLTLNCPVYDKIGESEPEIYFIEHRNVETRIAKDIVIFEGLIPNYTPSEIEDPYNYTPEEIKSKDEIFVYFIFDADRKSYVTPMAPKDKSK